MTQMMDDVISFGGNNLLSVPGLRITGTDTFRYPSRDVKNYHIANTNKSTTTSAFYSARPMNVRCVITRKSRDELDTSIGLLRQILEPKNQTLNLPIEGESRDLYEVTVSNIAIEDVGGGYAAIDIEFNCGDAYSYSLVTTTMLDIANNTSGNKSYPVTVYGTAKQAPIITLTLDSFTTGTNRTITLTEPLSGLQISVQRDWSAADVLVIDCLHQRVQVNGNSVAFSGNFLEWSPGAGFVNYTDDFTARQIDILVTYNKRYL